MLAAGRNRLGTVTRRARPASAARLTHMRRGLKPFRNPPYHCRSNGVACGGFKIGQRIHPRHRRCRQYHNQHQGHDNEQMFHDEFPPCEITRPQQSNCGHSTQYCQHMPGVERISDLGQGLILWGRVCSPLSAASSAPTKSSPFQTSATRLTVRGPGGHAPRPSENSTTRNQQPRTSLRLSGRIGTRRRSPRSQAYRSYDARRESST